MLRIYGTVLFGMKPRRNRSTEPVTPYLLGFMMITRSINAVDHNLNLSDAVKIRMKYVLRVGPERGSVQLRKVAEFC